MTTALAWGFVVATLLWWLGELPDTWPSIFFLASWGASAIVRETVDRAKNQLFWNSITVTDATKEDVE